MKTKKYSNSMKAVVALAMMFFISGVAYSQTIEERKGTSTTYSVAAGAATDEYTWTIEADVAPLSVTPAFSSGTGGPGDPGVINYTGDLYSIDVTWAADASPNISSTAAVVTVQKQVDVGGGNFCESALQTMNISFWSNPTGVIVTADQTACSADAIGGSITINLTGAPDAGQSLNDGFIVTYDVAVEDPLLTVTGPVGSLVGNNQSVSSDAATVTIPLPTSMVNADTGPLDYTITLQTVQDDFDDPAVAIVGQVYTITVYPIPTTGAISTSPVPLSRR